MVVNSVYYSIRYIKLTCFCVWLIPGSVGIYSGITTSSVFKNYTDAVQCTMCVPGNKWVSYMQGTHSLKLLTSAWNLHFQSYINHCHNYMLCSFHLTLTKGRICAHITWRMCLYSTSNVFLLVGRISNGWWTWAGVLSLIVSTAQCCSCES